MFTIFTKPTTFQLFQGRKKKQKRKMEDFLNILICYNKNISGGVNRKMINSMYCLISIKDDDPRTLVHMAMKEAIAGEY